MTNRWVYLYGTSTRALSGAFTGFALRVARTRLHDLEVQARWRYWDGNAGNADAAVCGDPRLYRPHFRRV